MSKPLPRLLLILFVSWTTASQCRASDWMFQDSYFHAPALARVNPAFETNPPWPVPQPRTATRMAVLPEMPGIALRGALRYNFYRLNNGSSQDITIFREFRVEQKR